MRGVQRSHDSGDQPTFSVEEYMKCYGYRLDGQRFSRCLLQETNAKVHDVCSGHMRDTARTPRLTDRDTRAHEVQTTLCVISIRPTFRMYVAFEEISF